MKIINRIKHLGLISLFVLPISAHSIKDITIIANSHQSCQLEASYYNDDDKTTTEAVCRFKKVSGGDDIYTCAIGTGNYNKRRSRLTIGVSDDKLNECKNNGGVDIFAIGSFGGWDDQGYNSTCTNNYFSAKSHGEWDYFSFLKPINGTITESIGTKNSGLGTTFRRYYEGMSSMSFLTKSKNLVNCTVWNSWAEKGRLNSDQVAKGFKFESKRFPGRYLQHNTYSDLPVSLDSRGNTWWIGDLNGVCPQDGDRVYLAKSEDNGDEFSNGLHEQYLRIQDRDSVTTNVDLDWVGSFETWKLEINSATGYNDCLSDGDEIRLKSDKTGRYMSATSQTDILIDETVDYGDRVKFYARASDYTPPKYAYAQQREVVGGGGGHWFDHEAVAQEALNGSVRVTKIQLNSGNRVDTIGFTYSDGTTAIHGDYDDPFSQYAGLLKWNSTYHLAEGEYVNYAKACVNRKNGSDRIFYLKLKTNFGKSIAGGTQSGTCTEFKESVAGDGSVLISPRGRSGAELDAIGFWQMVP